MKLIGLDVGTRRIGVAIADSSIRIAVPNTTVTVNNGLEFTEIARIARAIILFGSSLVCHAATKAD